MYEYLREISLKIVCYNDSIGKCKFALIFKYREKLLTLILVICCVLIGFSRIYVGVHYPLDVISGAIIGILSAYFVYRYWDEISQLFNKIKGSLF